MTLALHMSLQQRHAQQELEEEAVVPIARAARLEWAPSVPVKEPAPSAEEDLERPDWSAHFATTPLNVMEEAARKMMSRGAQGAPAWNAWREDLQTEAKDLAAAWGKRDKSTRVAAEPPSPSAATGAQGAAAVSAAQATRSVKLAASRWNQES